MKLTQLEKLQSARLLSETKRAAPRPGTRPMDDASRRERRRRDAALGLVPFAVKLDGALLKALHARAASHEGGMNALVAELLQKGLQAAK